MAFMLFALVVLSLAAAPPTTSKELNSAGMDKYKAKQLVEAIALFAQAIEAGEKEAPLSMKEQVERNRTLALAHFNRACSQALLRKAGRVCDGDAYRSTIMAHLEKAVLLDPSRLERVLADKDLAPIRDTIAYQGMLGFSAKREKDLPTLLSRTHWYSPGVGAFGSLSHVVFKPSGVVTEERRTMNDETGKMSVKQVTGTWTLAGRKLTVTLEGKAVEGTLGEDGKLVLNGVQFADEPSECGA